LSQASNSGGNTSAIASQLASAETTLQQAIQNNDASQASQIETQLESAQSAIQQLAAHSSQTTAQVAKTA
jgi:hypothetical protein